MDKTLKEITSRFNTTPFLFVGSGLSRRYYGLPDWESLLEVFASRISDDSFVLSSYKDRAKDLGDSAMLYPIMAQLIESDFNKMWFSDASKRKLSQEYLALVHKGISPFKAEIAMYISKNSILKKEYQNEIDKLKKASRKSISGIITTNYDNFLESIVDEYKVYIGQEELIFSPIQGLAEVYKIHGSIDRPDSIIINRNDYQAFDEKSSYLAAKLMTIFMEYPIVFIGYSLTDSNVQKIIKSIVSCLSSENIGKLEERFIFIEYVPGKTGVGISPHSMVFGDKMLYMTRISLSDFSLLYDALSEKKMQLPVKILRKFKEELYTYTITNTPTANLRVASIEDARVEDEELVLAIGKVGDFGLKGLSGLSGHEWYRNIVLSDLEFSADELLEYAFPKLIKQNSNKLPFFKLLDGATKEFDEVKALANEVDFDNIISKSIQSNRRSVEGYNSVMEVWEGEKASLEKATRLIAHLERKQIAVDELAQVLEEIFGEDPDILECETAQIKTNIRRLIRLYDYLKYAK